MWRSVSACFLESSIARHWDVTGNRLGIGIVQRLDQGQGFVSFLVCYVAWLELRDAESTSACPQRCDL